MNASVDLQSVMLRHLPGYKQAYPMSARQRQVCSHIMSCRTPIMGGVRMQCDQCDFTKNSYHACRDRHCPKCQRRVSQQWCDKQRESLLPVTYHHLVFTLPSELNVLVDRHASVIYNRLFKCAWHTLKTFGADPKRLNGKMGMTAVLHTWGENLSRHVHLHCLVPGGAIGATGQWHEARSNYLFPVRALSRHFRGSMVRALRQAVKTNPSTANLQGKPINDLLSILMSKEWVVYSKPCPVKARTVVDYLGRYSHRIAISDQRLQSFDDGRVRFNYKDYANGSARRDMELEANEFIRRLMLHVLPKGFMRIRHYGFLSNRCRKSSVHQMKVQLDRQKCSDKKVEPEKEKEQWCYRCPKCKQGQVLLASMSEQRLAEH